MPQGHWAAGLDTSEFKGLRRGRRYRVAKAFRDFDGAEHTEGETWFFLGHAFLPYDDGLSLFVSLDGHREWHVRMRWTPDDQGQVIDSLEKFVVKADAG